MKVKSRIPLQSKEIPGFGGFYRVDVFGQVWTCRIRCNVKNRRGAWKKKALSSVNFDGYPLVLLVLNGKQKEYRLHRLVLETFRGVCPPGMVARHFPDRNRENNRLSNLQWGTPKENTCDRYFHGTDQRGERNPRAKLTWEKVREIRASYQKGKQGQGRHALAKRFGVHPTQINRIVKGYSWGQR